MASDTGDNQIHTDEKRKQQPPLIGHFRQPDADQNQCAGQHPNQAVQQPVHAGIEPQIEKKLQNMEGGKFADDPAGNKPIAVGETAIKSLCRKFFFPLFAQGVVHLLAELHRHRIRLAVFVKRNGLTDVVHDHLAGIAARHVFLKFLADGRINRAVYIFIQHRQQFFAFHGVYLFDDRAVSRSKVTRFVGKTVFIHGGDAA